jgi:hypothetical protein
LRNRRETFQKTTCPLEQAFLYFENALLLLEDSFCLVMCPPDTLKRNLPVLYVSEYIQFFALATNYKMNQHSQWYLVISTILNSSTKKMGLGDPPD